jgi:hypothetical protein
MPLPLVVPDASVMLKWVLPSDDEPDTDRALNLLSTSILEESVRALGNNGVESKVAHRQPSTHLYVSFSE